MHTRSESNWLDASCSGNGNFIVRDYGRLGQVASELIRPGHQYPFLSVFLGKKTKDVALQSIFPQNNIRRTKPTASIGLRYDMISADSDNPILFADGDISADRVYQGPMPGVHDYPVTRNPSIVENASKLIYARLLFLFTDVICIFASDYPNLLSVAEFLVDCIRLRSASRLPEAIRPRVLVVLQEDPSHTMIDRYHKKLGEVDPTSFSTSFYSIDLFYLGHACSESTRYNSLRTWIKIQADNVQTVRRQNWAWWNVLHLKALFMSAIRQFASDDPTYFDIVKASREANPVNSGLSSHVSHYLELGVREGCSLETLLSAMASALLMDHYTPEMILLEPSAVFQTLYRSATCRAIRNNKDPTFSRPLADLVSALEKHFVEQFHSLVNSERLSADHRREQLLSISHELGRLQSDKICLYCLVRTAQHTLPCCHTICEVCPQLFGTPVSGIEYQFILPVCFLCHSRAKFVVNVLPPTMNPTILAIDGGGVRGGIPLEYMIMIQESLGPGCKLRDLIDLSIGSSSGGLLVLGLIGMEWDVALCSEKFDFLARRIFHERRQPIISRLLQSILGQDSLLGNIPKWLSWFLHDSCYDPRLFDSSLQEAFSRYKRIFDPASKSSHLTFHSKPKFGVVAASIAKDTRSFIFGNFNAVDWFSKGYDYEVFRAETRDTEPLMWEVARATAAAPFFFSTAHLRDIGSFQDGGLQNNFAAGIAARVYRRIWPSKNGIARLISLGTGDTGPSSERSPHYRHVFRDGFLRRGFDAFMANLGAASKWRLMVEQLNSAVRPDYIRMDVSLKDMPCTIDDVKAMDDYRNLVLRQPGAAKRAREAATAMLVARFFFTLDHHVEETCTETLTWCHGTIRCKGPVKPIVNALHKLHPETMEFITDSESLGKFGGLRDICPVCGRYTKQVTFLVRHLAEEKNIYIRISRHQKWRISGFPVSVSSLNMIQRLGDHPFGRPDHGRPAVGPCDSCDNQPSLFRGIRRKRTSSISSGNMGSKRVRVVDKFETN